MQSDPYLAATAAVAESTETVVAAHPPTPASCILEKRGSFIDWCLMSTPELLRARPCAMRNK